MSNPKSLLLKICSVCKEKKPLSAFLQLSDKQGTTYGNICASCRKQLSAKTTAPTPTDEESSGTSTKAKIDSKTKVHDAKDKRQIREQVDERYHEEREKDATQEDKQIQKTLTIAKEERKHREGFLEKPARPFLDTSEKAKRAADEQIFGGTAQTAKEQEIKTDAPFVDTGFIKQRSQGIAWQSFRRRLATSATGFGTEKQFLQKEDKKTLDANKKETLDFVEKTWPSGPGTKKR